MGTIGLDDLNAIANARGTTRSDHFRDGKGRILVQEILYEQKDEGPTFILRGKVVESSSKGDLDPVSKQPVIPNAPGSEVGYVQKVKKFKSAAGNIKKAVCNLLGYTEEEVDSKPGSLAKAVCRLADLDPATQQNIRKTLGATCQPARGMLLDYSTYQQMTKSGANAGKVNTYVNFIHVPPTAGNSPDEIATRRAQLDKENPLL